MQQFSVVLHEMRKWFESFGWYQLLRQFEMHLLFGGLGILVFRKLLYLLLPFGAYDTLQLIFFTIPLSAIAYHAFLIGAWMTLVSLKNFKYLPYAFWGYAAYILFPFTSISLSSLISAGVYAFLGYAVFKYSASSYAAVERA
ncbi:hypothetical protein [Paenibacillus abyssi]|uniref:Uncharacterized protein n=1 Tax=Paenibacillus abyssi TaxID=1340531 RepID=A0A917D2P6_9BACL|nr:hypothetical protein [Paenibacillus abyssi]GGG08997.1 hypothetical protein GCM10010916_27240 [Paenibacillus abyssi]